jgi:hypothetical protein
MYAESRPVLGGGPAALELAMGPTVEEGGVRIALDTYIRRGSSVAIAARRTRRRGGQYSKQRSTRQATRVVN